MPPPTISLSTLVSSVSSTVSFVDTLDPATIAINGRFGFSSAVSSASSSLMSNGPAQATGAKRATPCVLASARRSEEHTSELQSRENLVCRLLLEKKKKHTQPLSSRNDGAPHGV